MKKTIDGPGRRPFPAPRVRFARLFFFCFCFFVFRACYPLSLPFRRLPRRLLNLRSVLPRICHGPCHVLTQPVMRALTIHQRN